MLTREQIEEIQGDAREKGIAIKALLKEKGIPERQYFWWKRKYAKAEVRPVHWYTQPARNVKKMV